MTSNADTPLKPGLSSPQDSEVSRPSKNARSPYNPPPSQEFPSGVIVGSSGSFVSSLAFRDLQRLREIVIRKFYSHVVARHGWSAVPMAEVDKLIDSYGEKTRELLIKRAIDEGSVR